MRAIFFALASFLLAAASPAAALQPVTVVAHRGLEPGVPENTVAAFRQSVAHGVKIIEIDVRRTKDGQLVILHDATLDRTTDCSGPVTAIDLARLRSCDAGWPTNPGERVPTLSEALDYVGTTQARLLLDIKSAALGEVLGLVRDHRAESRVILGLRSARDVARARSELPSVAIIGFIPEIGDADNFAKSGATFLRLWSDWVDIDPMLVARTRKLGPEVWIVVGRSLPSKERDWRALHARMIAAGAQGLITNRPDLISQP